MRFVENHFSQKMFFGQSVFLFMCFRRNEFLIRSIFNKKARKSGKWKLEFLQINKNARKFAELRRKCDKVIAEAEKSTLSSPPDSSHSSENENDKELLGVKSDKKRKKKSKKAAKPVEPTSDSEDEPVAPKPQTNKRKVWTYQNSDRLTDNLIVENIERGGNCQKVTWKKGKIEGCVKLGRWRQTNY